MANKWEDNEEIKIFREYLRIASVHPNPDYKPCVDFLKRQADSLGMQFRVFYPVNENNPAVVLSLAGSEPSLPTILLNSHMDVVPVFPDKWTYPPFSAHVDAEGRIFARGTQDMKCVGTQYLAALRALKRTGKTLKRTIHVLFVPDEELGGYLGMREFVHTEDFRCLNVGFALDEGLTSETEAFILFYGDKSPWQVTFKCSGTPGHGATPLEDTAGEKISYIIGKVMEMRSRECAKMKKNSSFFAGTETVINLTKLEGGVQANVVPPLLSVTFDMRLAINLDHEAFFRQLQDWCAEAGGGIEMVFARKDKKSPVTKLDDSNIFWVAFKAVADEMQLKLQPIICPATTDSPFLREVGIPALGFSPISNTPLLIHAHDEFIFAEGYLKGIEMYQKIIHKIANC
ncbi:aminoacylase-1-like [Phlebotomus argentipes]|uniref:aminoacylase-1-like n=1 Tax=Phlebotomus argentipes TaxID=94469 RepID=UPI002892F3A0|nr:aminoacylase-1-like [Phlebotomus argentipes]